MSNNPFRIFRSLDYSLYFGGQLISQVGTWMQQIAISWLTYKLTNSAFLLAVVGVSSMLPSIVFMPFAGVISDRFNRHRIVILTQAVAMIESAVLAYLALTHQIQVWQLIALGLVMGVVNAFDMPVRSSFVIDLVKNREDLPATIAMNSSLMNVSRLFGPALAGFVVAAYGEGICFALNSASYVVVIIALLFIKGNFQPEKTERTTSVVEEFMEGVRYTARTAPLRAPILLLAAFGLGGMAYAQLLPVYVQQLHGDANTLGYLSSASAFGSVCGTALLATRKSVIGLGKWIIVASFCYAASLLAFAFANSFWLALPALACVGAAMMVQMGACNTILQAVVDPDKRGRVMSLFALAFLGTVPLGSLVGGAIASKFGFSTTVLVSGIYCLIISILFTTQIPRLRQETKPIYVELGLLEAEEELDIVTKPSA